jgi:hypothetical protein
MALVMTATQQCDLSIEVFDSKGNPATIDGTPVWSVSEEAYLTVEPDTDSMTALVKAVGPITTSPVQVNVTVDADLGEGVRQIIGVLDISVVAGEAVSIGISAGTPEEQEA